MTKIPFFLDFLTGISVLSFSTKYTSLLHILKMGNTETHFTNGFRIRSKTKKNDFFLKKN